MKACFVYGEPGSCRTALKRSAVGKMLAELDHCIQLLGLNSNNRNFDPSKHVREGIFIRLWLESSVLIDFHVHQTYSRHLPS